MGDRLLWGAMDLEGGTVPVYGARCALKTQDFATRDAADPWALSGEERAVVDGLVAAFTGSERLRAQVQWLYDHGGVYRVAGDGSLLLLHGCVPLDGDGGLAAVACDDGRARAGKGLLDHVDLLCRRAWEGRAQGDLDWMGYLWCGWQSTFAGRVVKTFERTYIADKETWKEPEDPYYALTREDAGACAAVLADFGLDPATARLVNGHTPVKLPKGEKPVRAQGRRIVIDGGLCAAYRKTTGIAGYTLVRRADGSLLLVAHGEFPGEAAVFGAAADVEHRVEPVA
jgi:fructose-1,6-bisphosphatase-3